MKIHNNSCYLCGKNDPQILFPVFYKAKRCDLENIVICKHCGLVYKHPIVPENEILHYMEKGHWDDPYFDKRLEETAKYVYNELGTSIDHGTIVDIGAAAGHLLFHLGTCFRNERLVGIEPSEDACNVARDRDSRITMLHGTLEDCTIQNKSIDLVTAIGVDYLFLDHTEALKKIHGMLKDSGYLYIERNVFLTSKAYRISVIDTTNDLFGRNSMMKTWFTPHQMSLQLSKFFKIIKVNKFTANIVSGHKNIHYGWLCQKSEIDTNIRIPNLYKENLEYVRTLREK